jgi:hypothetical protein
LQVPAVPEISSHPTHISYDFLGYQADDSYSKSYRTENSGISYDICRPQETGLSYDEFDSTLIVKAVGIREFHNHVKRNDEAIDELSSKSPVDAVIRLQSLWRSYSCSMKFVKTIIDVLIIQSLIRRWLAVRRCQRIKGLQYRIQGELHHDDKVVADGHGAAIIIQKVWRGKKTQLSFVYDLIKIIISQVRWIVRMLWTILPFFFSFPSIHTLFVEYHTSKIGNH